MPKNLIILHLESISNTFLWQYRAELATVWRLIEQSRFYSRFYSNTTSTEMAVQMLMFGSTAYRDYCSVFNDPSVAIPEFMHYGGYLLYDAEYLSYGFTLDYYRRMDTMVGNADCAYYHCSTPANLFAKVRETLAHAKRVNRPVAVYLNDQTTHMALDNEAKFRAPTFSERFRQSYLGIDANINQMLSILMETGMWDNSLIVGIGDHGDELWSHGLNRGYCHVIQPYASLTWTPMFIYDNGRDAGVTDQIASIIDLRETLIKKLIPDFTPGSGGDPVTNVPFDAAPWHGVDLAKETRDRVFMQNLYALQLEYSDPEQGLTKGYAVTDGVYRVVASSGGDKPKEGGLEFYCDRVDPTNSRNLLDFFVLGVDGEPLAFRPPTEAVSGEFAAIFNPEAVRRLMETFSLLRRELHAYVRDKETWAKQYNNRRHHTMPERAFTVARKRIRRD